MNIGAYAVEQDYSHYISQSAKTALAVVGTATKGPIGVPTACTTLQDLVDKFGPLYAGSANEDPCYALYAAQYFLTQSSRLYFVRAAHEESGKDESGVSLQDDVAAEATAKIKGLTSTGQDVLEALTFTANEKGTYANGYILSVVEGKSVASQEEDEEGNPVMVPTYTLILQSPRRSSLETIVKDATIETLVSTDFKFEGRYVKFKSSTPTITSLVAGEYVFSGGDNGIKDIDAGDYINALNSLAREDIDINLFAVPGQSDKSIISAMDAIAETRGDSIFFVDPPEGLNRDGVIDWHNGVGSYTGKLNSMYGVLYYDWCTIYDSTNKVRLSVPPSVFVPASYAYNDRISEVWYAPAGLQRGLVRGVLESNTSILRGDISLLYSEGNNINPIHNDPQVGLVLWGQKTLYREDTALNRVNVRRLLNYLKKVVTAACNYLTFEPNDRVTWNSFSMKVKPVLESILAKRGIYEYRIIRGDSIVTEDDINDYKMPAMILIRPTKAAEEIPIYFTLTSTGADFNEVLDMNGVRSANTIN